MIYYFFSCDEVGPYVPTAAQERVTQAYAEAVRRALSTRLPDRDVVVGRAWGDGRRIVVPADVSLATVLDVVAEVQDDDEFWGSVLREEES